MTIEAHAEADFLGIGQHCSHSECNQLDFLPFRCSGCSQIFCADHRTAAAHSCPHATADDIQVIVCPQCARAVRLAPGEDPNITFDRHVRSNNCDPSNYAKVHAKKKCPVKGCREKLVSTNSYFCKSCGATLCLRHRLTEDHACAGPQSAAQKRTMSTANSYLKSKFSQLFASSGNSTTGNSTTGNSTTTSNNRTATAPAPVPPSRIASAKASIQTQLKEYRSNKAQQKGQAKQQQVQEERCPQCGQQFSSIQELLDHAAAVHQDGWSSPALRRPPPGQGGIERCPHCAATFDDPVALVNHVERQHQSVVVGKVTAADGCVML